MTPGEKAERDARYAKDLADAAKLVDNDPELAGRAADKKLTAAIDKLEAAVKLEKEPEPPTMIATLFGLFNEKPKP